VSYQLRNKILIRLKCSMTTFIRYNILCYTFFRYTFCIKELITLYTNNLNNYFILTFFLAFGICGFFGGIVVQFWMIIYMIDADSSTNASRPYHILFTMEYFIDQEKYYYLILLHINIAICFSCAIVVAIGAMIITFFQHICGIFKIAWYI
jgi:hypothetical protein